MPRPVRRGRVLLARPVALAIATVMVIVGTACTGSGAGDPPVGVLDPQRLATAGTLTIDAFPPPWRAIANRSDPSGFDACPGVAGALRRARATRSTSPEFSDRDVERVEESVAVYNTVSDAERVMVTVRSDAFAACLRSLLDRAARQALSNSPRAATGRVTTSLTTEASRPRGDERVTYRVTVSTARSGSTTDQYVDADLVRVGRVIVALLAQRRGAPPGLDRTRLLGILASRIRSANGT